jgi:hypothetical protein
MFLQLMGQPSMSNVIELQAKQTLLGWDAQITQAQWFVDEVEIVGHALTAVWLQIRFAAGPVVPRAGTIHKPSSLQRYAPTPPVHLVLSRSSECGFLCERPSRE